MKILIEVTKTVTYNRVVEMSAEQYLKFKNDLESDLATHNRALDKLGSMIDPTQDQVDASVVDGDVSKLKRRL